jgi:hypothetical protein
VHDRTLVVKLKVNLLLDFPPNDLRKLARRQRMLDTLLPFD